MSRILILLGLFFQLGYGLEKVHYRLEMDPIDVVIFCIEKDLPTLDLCIEGIRKNGKDVRRIIVVSPRQLTNKAEWFSEKNYPFQLFDIAMEFFGGNENKAKKFLSGHSRSGWIYQQLLKLYSAFVIPDISSNVLVLDADTIFLNPVSFRTSSGEGLYNPGFQSHHPYFEHMQRLIPGLKRISSKYSGIANYMLFQRAVLQDLLSTIESIHHIEAWKAFCRCIDHQHLNFSSMSEYEIYFNFVFSRTNQMKIEPLLWEDRARITDLGLLQSKGYSYATCHSWNQ